MRPDDRELDEELRDHVERQVDANIASGMTPEQARTAALRAIGGVEQRKEECRDTRGLGPFERIVADTRYAIRVLKRSPVFAVVAIASLAFGIGAFLAMFQLVDAIRLRALPVENAHELVELEETSARHVERAHPRASDELGVERLRRRAGRHEQHRVGLLGQHLGHQVRAPSGHGCRVRESLDVHGAGG